MLIFYHYLRVSLTYYIFCIYYFHTLLRTLIDIKFKITSYQTFLIRYSSSFLSVESIVKVVFKKNNTVINTMHYGEVIKISNETDLPPFLEPPNDVFCKSNVKVGIIAKKIQPAHFIITKRVFILRGSCFCGNYNSRSKNNWPPEHKYRYNSAVKNHYKLIKI